MLYKVEHGGLQASGPYQTMMEGMRGKRCCCRDWMGKYAGKSKLALRPKSTEQVSKVLAYCNDRRLAIVPQVHSSL